MKKVLFFLLLTLFTQLSLTADDKPPTKDPSKEKIPIIILTGPFNKKDKQPDKNILVSLDAYINTTSNTIEINSAGIESDLGIYITNSRNEVIIYETIEAGMTDFIITDAPVYPGRYLLAITSDEIYGEGIFTIK